eukprot:gene11003-7646_t
MRLSTFHRHTVQRTSPLLGLLLFSHLVYTICFAAPALLVGYSQFFKTGSTKPWTPTWAGFMLFLWLVIEAPRFYFGFSVNRTGLLLYAMAFIVICVFPQMVLIIVYLAKVSYASDVELGICALELILLTAEVLAAVHLAVRLGMNDTINFYVRLGAIQRQAAAEELQPLTSSGGAGGGADGPSKWGTHVWGGGTARQSMIAASRNTPSRSIALIIYAVSFHRVADAGRLDDMGRVSFQASEPCTRHLFVVSISPPLFVISHIRAHRTSELAAGAFITPLLAGSRHSLLFWCSRTSIWWGYTYTYISIYILNLFFPLSQTTEGKQRRKGLSMSFDYTATLRHLFHEKQQRSAAPGATPSATERRARQDGDGRSTSRTHQKGKSSAAATGYTQLVEVTSRLTATAEEAVEQARGLIHRTLVAMDHLSGATGSVMESELSLAEVKLASAADSIKITLEGVLQRTADRRTSEEPNGGEDVPSLSHISAASCHNAAARVPHVLLHVERILEQERAAIAAARIQLALCKSEVRAFAARHQFYLAGGVRPFEESLMEQRKASGSSRTSSSSSSSASISSKSGSSSDGEGGPARAAGGEKVPVQKMELCMVTGSKALLESVVQRVSNAVRGDDSAGRSGDRLPHMLNHTLGGGHSAGASTAPPPLDVERASRLSAIKFTPEEEASLGMEHAALEQRQREALAEDAMEVESAVRDLSHLNGLVNEAVLTQREKFSILLRNTEEAQSSMRHAVKELEKPQGWWNAKRQLIALLWMCTVVMLTANWLIRLNLKGNFPSFLLLSPNNQQQQKINSLRPLYTQHNTRALLSQLRVEFYFHFHPLVILYSHSLPRSLSTNSVMRRGARSAAGPVLLIGLQQTTTLRRAAGCRCWPTSQASGFREPRVTTAIATALRWNSGGSRFTRQGGPPRPSQGPPGAGGPPSVEYGVNQAGCTGQQFLTLLHRLRAEYKQQPTENRRQQSLRVLAQFSLKRVTNMDGRIVFQLLDLLARLKAPGEDFALIQEAAAWLGLYGSSPSTSPALIPQCLRSLLLLDCRELVLPVVMGCQSAITALESQQRAMDSCVVLLAALLRGLVYHDRRSTTSPQQLLPLMERLLTQVAASNMEHASSTDLRLLLESVGTARQLAPELLTTVSSSRSSMEREGQHPWWECVRHLRSVLAHERAEEVSGSLDLPEALQLVLSCNRLFPVPRATTTSSSEGEGTEKNESGGAPPWDPEEVAIRDSAAARALELLDVPRPPASVVLLLQELVLQQQQQQTAAEGSPYAALCQRATGDVETYFRDGEAAPDVAVTILRMCCETAGVYDAAQERPPTHPLALLLGPPPAPAHTAPSFSSEGSPRAVELASLVPRIILDRIEEAWAVKMPPPGAAASLNGSTTSVTFVWSPQSVNTLVRSFALDPHYQDHARQLRTYYFSLLRATFSQTPAVIAPSDFAPFFASEAMEEPYFQEVVEMITTCMAHWSVTQVLHWLRVSAVVPCNAAIRTMMRAGAKSLAPFMDRASGEQLVALMYYFGNAGVRQDEFCDGVAKRVGKLCEEAVGRTPEEASGGLLSLPGLAVLLSGFAGVEYRSSKPFLDAAPVITQALAGDAAATPAGTNRDTTPFALSAVVLAESATTLLAAYAKMLVWHFQVVWSLAECLARSCTHVITLRQLVVAQLALLRMDVKHDALRAAFQQRVLEWAESAEGQRDALSTTDTVALLSVWSRVEAPPADSFCGAALEATPEAVTRRQTILNAFLRVLRRRMTSLTPEEQAEVLLSLARVGEGREPNPEGLFDQLTTQIIGTIPQTTPLALSHAVNAYALCGRLHEELFSLVSQRVIRTKNNMAAVTIASILSAFAATGCEDTVFFMEMIPRVRFVAQFGTPRDVTNVVFAYATIKVWHYKLFSRLADRAIQLRGEFSPAHLTRLLQAYGMVGMRYDSLFTEMAVRVQAVAHLLQPSELVTLVESYAAVNILSPPVFEACADQAEAIAESFTLEEAERFLGALESMGHVHPRAWLALHNQFPNELRGRYLGVQQKAVPSSECANLLTHQSSQSIYISHTQQQQQQQQLLTTKRKRERESSASHHRRQIVRVSQAPHKHAFPLFSKFKCSSYIYIYINKYFTLIWISISDTDNPESQERVNQRPMPTIIFVTGNEGKLREVQGFLSHCPSIRIQAHRLDLTEVQEASAERISRAKAVEALRAINHLPPGAIQRTDGAPLEPVLVEDTSLCFDVLGDLPGPYVKWFIEAVGCEGLAHMVDGFASTRKNYRAARAKCIFSYCTGFDPQTQEPDVVQFVGECYGHVLPAPQGKNGFGWDPIFAPDIDQERRTPGTVSFAEMPMAKKAEISHRTNALMKLREHFSNPQRHMRPLHPIRRSSEFSGSLWALRRGQSFGLLYHVIVVAPKRKTNKQTNKQTNNNKKNTSHQKRISHAAEKRIERDVLESRNAALFSDPAKPPRRSPPRWSRLRAVDVAWILAIGVAYYLFMSWLTFEDEELDEPLANERIQDPSVNVEYAQFLETLSQMYNAGKEPVLLATPGGQHEGLSFTQRIWRKGETLESMPLRDSMCRRGQTENCIPFGKKTVVAVEVGPNVTRQAVVYVPLVLQQTLSSSSSSGKLSAELPHSTASAEDALHRRRVPVLLMFHGLGDNCDRFLGVKDFVPRAEEHHVILVSACGSVGYLGVGWNAGMCCGFGNDSPNDVGFAQVLVKALEYNIPEVDPYKIVAMGFSNGAMLSEVLGCTSSDLIDAVVSVGGVTEMRPGNEDGLKLCSEAMAATDARYRGRHMGSHVLMIHGDADWKVPWNGNVYFGFPSMPRNIDTWLERQMCDVSENVTTLHDDKFENIIYTKCGDGRRWLEAGAGGETQSVTPHIANPLSNLEGKARYHTVEVVRAKGKGHVWPSEPAFDTTAYIFEHLGVSFAHDKSPPPSPPSVCIRLWRGGEPAIDVSFHSRALGKKRFVPRFPRFFRCFLSSPFLFFHRQKNTSPSILVPPPCFRSAVQKKAITITSLSRTIYYETIAFLSEVERSESDERHRSRHRGRRGDGEGIPRVIGPRSSSGRLRKYLWAALFILILLILIVPLKLAVSEWNYPVIPPPKNPNSNPGWRGFDVPVVLELAPPPLPKHVRMGFRRGKRLVPEKNPSNTTHPQRKTADRVCGPADVNRSKCLSIGEINAIDVPLRRNPLVVQKGVLYIPSSLSNSSSRAKVSAILHETALLTPAAQLAGQRGASSFGSAPRKPGSVEEVERSTNALTNSTLAPDADTNSTLAPDAETNSTLAPDAETNSTLAPDAETNSTLAPDAHTNSTLAPDAETNSTLAPDAETNSTLAPDAETNSTLAPDAETNSTLAPDAETNSTLARDAHTNSTLAPDAETNSTLAPDAETNSTLAPDAETNSTLAPDAETNSTLAPDAETNSTLAPDAETNSTLAPDAETNSTLAPDAETNSTLAPDAETNSTLAPDAETNSTLAPDAETNSTLAPDAETNSTLAPDAETNSTLAPDAHTNSTLAPDAETNSTLAPDAHTNSTLAPDAETNSTLAPDAETNSTLAPDAETNSTLAPDAETNSTLAPDAHTNCTTTTAPRKKNERLNGAPILFFFPDWDEDCTDNGEVMERLAEKEEIVVVQVCKPAEAGVRRGGPTAQDVEDALDLMDAVLYQVPLADSTKVIAAGAGPGAFLSQAIGCNASDQVRAVISIGGTTVMTDTFHADNLAICNEGYNSTAHLYGATLGLHVLMIHGDADEKVPWMGDKNLGYPSVPDAVLEWRKRMVCEMNKEAVTCPLDKTKSYETIEYPPCDAVEASVELVRGIKKHHRQPPPLGIDEFSVYSYMFEFIARCGHFNLSTTTTIKMNIYRLLLHAFPCLRTLGDCLSLSLAHVTPLSVQVEGKGSSTIASTCKKAVKKKRKTLNNIYESK